MATSKKEKKHEAFFRCCFLHYVWFSWRLIEHSRWPLGWWLVYLGYPQMIYSLFSGRRKGNSTHILLIYLYWKVTEKPFSLGWFFSFFSAAAPLLASNASSCILKFLPLLQINLSFRWIFNLSSSFCCFCIKVKKCSFTGLCLSLPSPDVKMHKLKEFLITQPSTRKPLVKPFLSLLSNCDTKECK